MIFVSTFRLRGVLQARPANMGSVISVAFDKGSFHAGRCIPCGFCVSSAFVELPEG